MEQLIQFLEKYWGVTIVGGMTFGTIITFIVVQIKTFISDKLKNAEIDRLTTLVGDMIQQAKVSDQERTALEARNSYLERVQTVTFKAISYIVVASKLPTEDKLALQADFTKLAEDGAKLMEQVAATPTTPTAKEFVESVVEEVQEAIPEVIQEVATGTANLLSKYVGGKHEG